MDFVNRKKFIKNIKLGLKEACEKYFLSILHTKLKS